MGGVARKVVSGWRVLGGRNGARFGALKVAGVQGEGGSVQATKGGKQKG